MSSHSLPLPNISNQLQAQALQNYQSAKSYIENKRDQFNNHVLPPVQTVTSATFETYPMLTIWGAGFTLISVPFLFTFVVYALLVIVTFFSIAGFLALAFLLFGGSLLLGTLFVTAALAFFFTVGISSAYLVYHFFHSIRKEGNIKNGASSFIQTTAQHLNPTGPSIFSPEQRQGRDRTPKYEEPNYAYVQGKVEEIKQE